MKLITYYGATDTGILRDNNEDTFISQYLWDDSRVLCVAIDGLGGYEGGEIAAGIARDTITSYLRDNRNGSALDLLSQAVTEANNRIVEHQQKTPGCNRMGCVLTAGLFELETMRLNVAHVGDSRMYRWRAGKLDKLTHDHSLVGYREDHGELTEEQAMNHPQRNLVDRILGDKVHMLDDKNFIEAFIEPIVAGDRYVFCSDGLSDMITSAEISQIITLHQSDGLRATVDGLINAALAHGGKDNVTVVMAMVEDSEASGEVPVVGAVDEEPQQPHAQTETPVQGAEKADGVTGLGNDADISHRHSPARRPWQWIVACAVALAVCAAAYYGGYRHGRQAQLAVQSDSLNVKHGIIEALKDKVDEHEQTIITLNDSISNMHKVAKARASKQQASPMFTYDQIMAIYRSKLKNLNR